MRVSFSAAVGRLALPFSMASVMCSALLVSPVATAVDQTVAAGQTYVTMDVATGKVLSVSKRPPSEDFDHTIDRRLTGHGQLAFP
ncbi:hypothetical protein [Streptosporangium lutulentum]|uniref:D-alanyl-D-alanine carboxypeptidase n=1 Tax=Streptosporangium lutulentum TaxID=1461250 RepID=A0ABT9QU11_9ACTN|nr:hypothetical protein [Streptosporangium lutulentum]MDP9850262.1 D-alanyl-D-alanine carboxypeptidase [Streptosporangium lutulentum]